MDGTLLVVEPTAGAGALEGDPPGESREPSAPRPPRVADVVLPEAPLLKSSEDRDWGTTVKWLSELSLCVCVRTCFVGCPKVRPLLPTESTSQIVPTSPSAPPSRAHTDAHALAPNRITHQINSH